MKDTRSKLTKFKLYFEDTKSWAGYKKTIKALTNKGR